MRSCGVLLSKLLFVLLHAVDHEILNALPSSAFFSFVKMRVVGLLLLEGTKVMPSDCRAVQ